MKALAVTLLLAVVGSACAGSDTIYGEAPRLGSDLELATWHAIERAEYARCATPTLLNAAASPEDAIRARAVIALGRLRWPEVRGGVTDALLARLADDEPKIRATAAFALGQRGDPAAGDALVQRAFGSDPGGDPLEDEEAVRARAVEAASKLDRPDLQDALLAGLDDPALGVRMEAAIAAHRFEPSTEVDATLLDSLKTARGTPLAAALLFSLQRRRSGAALPAFVAYAESARPIERLWAVRGLARIAPSSQAEDALRRAIGDDDDRVVFEALVGLGRYPADGLTDAFRRAATHPSAHVRAQALRSIRSAGEVAGAETTEVIRVTGSRLATDRQRWRSWAEHPSTEVRRAAAQALPEELFASGAAWPFATDESPYVRAAWAERLGEAERFDDAHELERLLGDPHPVVVAAAIRTLSLQADSRDRVRAFVRHEDNGLRLAALEALGRSPEPADLPSLEHAYFTSTGDVGVEVRFNALRTAAAIESEEARTLLERALEDEAPFVRRTAHDELVRLGDGERALQPAVVDPEAAPLHGIDWSFDRNPWVEIVTNRGQMRFELFPFEAPWHVHNFLALAADGHYDGLTFHRVVPDFVIQGGDYRGDGSGGRTVNGIPLRNEIGPRKFVRGSLGMPRHEDWDSGGSQLFVTHRPTPHLDGRYTIFGELRSGFGVLDRVEVGDTIVHVAEIEPPELPARDDDDGPARRPER